MRLGDSFVWPNDADVIKRILSIPGNSLREVTVFVNPTPKPDVLEEGSGVLMEVLDLVHELGEDQRENTIVSRVQIKPTDIVGTLVYLEVESTQAWTDVVLRNDHASEKDQRVSDAVESFINLINDIAEGA